LKLNNWIEIIYGAGGHSKVELESMGKTIYGIFDDNQCVEKRGDKGRKGIQFRAKIPVLESPVIISIGNNEGRNCRIIQ
jgi:hypothetical protein